jgi:hypothetical protein
MTATHRCATLFVLLALTGCATKWEVQKAPAADVLKFSDGDACLVTRVSGAQVELREARVDHDSLIGVKKDEATGPAENARLAIALTDVRSIAVRKPDGVATTFWVSLAGVFAVMLAFGALMSAADGGT